MCNLEKYLEAENVCFNLTDNKLNIMYIIRFHLYFANIQYRAAASL